MVKRKSKIFIVSNKCINQEIENLLYKSLAKQIFKSERFQKILNASNGRHGLEKTS